METFADHNPPRKSRQTAPRNGEEMSVKKSHPKPPPGYKVIFRPWRTDPKTGKKLFAHAFGLKAWPIFVPE